MCNLYSLNKKRDAVARFFRVSHNRSAAYEPASAIFPRHVAPVVRESADGERRNRHDELGLHALAERACKGRVPNTGVERCVTLPILRFPRSILSLTSLGRASRPCRR